MYSLFRPLLFSLDPEKAHALSLSILKYSPKLCFKQPQKKSFQCMGISFDHPIGLAAGLDKNGDYLDALSKLGFAFIELGTVTPKPQFGNPKPRLFRLIQNEALINRMGFNNAGVDALISNIKKSSYTGVLGINIGKNKDTSLNDAADDYLYCMNKVYEYASYICINISSPNTPNLRLLQQKEYLDDLLIQLQRLRNKLSNNFQRYVPLVVKLSPDETDESLKEISELILKYKIDGIIATNTTCSRDGLENYQVISGGLSGRPLTFLSTRSLTLLKKYVGNHVSLIGSGGIMDCKSAKEKVEAGASLLQIYTGLIFRGPLLASELVEGLER